MTIQTLSNYWKSFKYAANFINKKLKINESSTPVMQTHGKICYNIVLIILSSRYTDSRMHLINPSARFIILRAIS